MEKTIIIRDYDDPTTIFNVLKVKATKEEVEKAFQEVKDNLAGCWTVEDLIEGLAERNIEFTQEGFFDVEVIDV